MAPKDPERVTDSDSPSETLSVQRDGGTFQRGPNLNLGFVFLLFELGFSVRMVDRSSSANGVFRKKTDLQACLAHHGHWGSLPY